MGKRVALFALFVLVPLASAQDFPRAEVYGGYSYLNVDTNNITSRQSFNGWDASLSVNALKWIGGEGDFAGYYKKLNVATLPGIGSIDLSTHGYAFLFGPKATYKMVFVHALFGVDRLSGSILGVSLGSQNSFSGAVGGGIEVPFSKHFAVRGAADYAFTRHNIFGGSRVTQNNVRASAGIVYRFGFGGTTSVASGSTKNTTRVPGRASMPIPSLGISVSPPQQGIEGAEIVAIQPGSVAQMAVLHVGDLITSVNDKLVKTPMELAAALNGISGNVKLGYGFRTETGWYIGKETTVILGK